jgi:hypothetical protein
MQARRPPDEQQRDNSKAETKATQANDEQAVDVCECK